MNIHAQARTTKLIRAEIKASELSERKLAKKYNITRSTVRKWKNRAEQDDLSHRPHNMQTTLSTAQELIVVELRKSLFLPLDDLVAVTKEFIHPDVSRSGIARCLKRYGLSNLKQMLREQAEIENSPKLAIKGFKDYEPGFVHVDIKYLPQMADDSRVVFKNLCHSFNINAQALRSDTLCPIHLISMKPLKTYRQEKT